MYAIIQDSGRQYKVEKNTEILIDYRDAEEGGEMVFDSVVALKNKDKLETGSSTTKVTGTVLGVEKGEKIVIRKFKRRKKMRRKTGHRQKYLRVKINEISG